MLLLISIPTPLLFIDEWCRKVKEPYGLVLKTFEQSLDADTKFLLHILMSDSIITSLLSFVIPYNFLSWLCLEDTDIFNELQFILEIFSSGRLKFISNEVRWGRNCTSNWSTTHCNTLIVIEGILNSFFYWGTP